MNSSRTARLFLVCLLAAALAVPARGASPGGRSTRPADPVARLWSALTAVWAEAGCWIDPHGGHCSAGQSEAPAPLPGTDAGCGIDPHGGCTAGS